MQFNTLMQRKCQRLVKSVDRNNKFRLNVYFEEVNV